MKLRDYSEHGYGLDVTKLPASAKDAERIGSRFFFTGKPCKHGHVSPRYTKASACVQCQRVVNIKKTDLDPTRVNKKAERHHARRTAYETGQTTYVPAEPCKQGHTLRWVSTNNCVQCDADARVRHKISGKLARIKKEYGLTREQYFALVDKQGGRCAICAEQPDSHFSLHIDHCHDTNVVRGLLCQQCNQALGLFKEDAMLMQSAINYLLAR
jgi:hypothetical protein